MSILSTPSSVANTTSSDASSSVHQPLPIPTSQPLVRADVREKLLAIHYGPLVDAIGLTALHNLREIKGDAIQLSKENLPYISPEKMLYSAVRGRYINRYDHRFFIAYKFQARIVGTKGIKTLNIVNLFIHKEPFSYKEAHDFGAYIRIQMSYNADISNPHQSVKWNLKKAHVEKGLDMFKKLLTTPSCEMNVNFRTASYSSHCSLTNDTYPPHACSSTSSSTPSTPKLFVFTGNESE